MPREEYLLIRCTTLTRNGGTHTQINHWNNLKQIATQYKIMRITLQAEHGMQLYIILARMQLPGIVKISPPTQSPIYTVENKQCHIDVHFFWTEQNPFMDEAVRTY